MADKKYAGENGLSAIFAQIKAAIAGKADAGLVNSISEDIEELQDGLTDNYKVMGEMGAKNLIPYPYYESNHTESGITWTVNSDGSITANGTATADSTFILRHRLEQTKFIEKNTSYILSGCPSGGSNSKYYVRLFVKNQDDSNIVSGTDYGNGVTIDMPNQDYYGIYALARVISGQTVSNLTFKPMLRLASITDDTYQPYAKTNKQLTDDVALLDSGLNDLTANKYGTIVSLLSYTEDTYTFPNDGYIILSTDTVSTVEVRVYGMTGVTYFTMKAINGINIPLFVKKGMRALVSSTSGTGGNVRYFPLIV